MPWEPFKTYLLNDEAKVLYEQFHDEIVEYRQKDRFEESKLSVKSKSLGLVLRVAAVISLLNYSVDKQANVQHQHSNLVTKIDFEMAKKIVQSSVSTAFALLQPEESLIKPKKSSVKNPVVRMPVPEADSITLDYLVPYHRQVKHILAHERIPLSTITRDKIYPIVNNESGSRVASKFIMGLQQLGFGTLSPKSKSFKRFSPETEECPDRENLKKKYKALNIDFRNTHNDEV